MLQHGRKHNEAPTVEHFKTKNRYVEDHLNSTLDNLHNLGSFDSIIANKNVFIFSCCLSQTLYRLYGLSKHKLVEF